MAYIIKATAPTAYQLNSLRAFGMSYKDNGNGSFKAIQEFENEQSAQDYLRQRAEIFCQDRNLSEEQLAEMMADIDHGVLHLDGVSAHIEELEIESE